MSFDKHRKTAEANDQIRWSVGDDFKIIISTKSNPVESNHSGESDILRI